MALESKSHCIHFSAKRCIFESIIYAHPGGHTSPGVRCKVCTFQFGEGTYVQVGNPPDVYESPGWPSILYEDPRVEPVIVRAVILGTNPYAAMVGNRYFNVEWVVMAYEVGPLVGPFPIPLPDFTHYTLPDAFVGPVAPTQAPARQAPTLPALPALLECTCTSLIFGHVSGCSYAARQRGLHKKNGELWRL